MVMMMMMALYKPTMIMCIAIWQLGSSHNSFDDRAVNQLGWSDHIDMYFYIHDVLDEHFPFIIATKRIQREWTHKL